MTAVEVEAVVLVVVIMRSVMVLGEGVITATMIEEEGLEAEVLVEGVDEAEVLDQGETGVGREKVVLREGQKSNSGIKKERRLGLVEIITARLMTSIMIVNIIMAVV